MFFDLTAAPDPPPSKPSRRSSSSSSSSSTAPPTGAIDLTAEDTTEEKNKKRRGFLFDEEGPSRSSKLQKSSKWDINRHMSTQNEKERPLRERLSSILESFKDMVKQYNRIADDKVMMAHVLDLTTEKNSSSSSSTNQHSQRPRLDTVAGNTLRNNLQSLLDRSGFLQFLADHISQSTQSFLEVENHADMYYLVFQGVQFLAECPFIQNLLVVPVAAGNLGELTSLYTTQLQSFFLYLSAQPS